MSIYDNADNDRTYYGAGYSSFEYISKDYPESVLTDEYCNLTITVTNVETEDITAPTLTEISLGAASANAPGVIEVIADGKDDVSGVSGIRIYFENTEKEKGLSVYLNNYYYDSNHKKTMYEDGKFHGEMDISQYAPSGDYIISRVSIYDNADNDRTYYGAGYSSFAYISKDYPESVLTDEYCSLTIDIMNDGKQADIATSTISSNFLENVINAENNAVIIADYSSDSKLSKETFEAIKGTEKILQLTSNGIQWEFKGTDIVKDIKDIDLQMQINYISQSYGEDSDAIKELVDTTNTVVLKFPENGELPGKAKIRVKADYSMRKYIGVEGINVYYFDNTENKLVPICSNIAITPDYYFEFEIEHCSYYILTEGKVEENNNVGENEEVEKNDIDE